MLVSHRPNRARYASAAAVNTATRGPASRHATTTMTVMTTGHGVSTNTVSSPFSTEVIAATTLSKTPAPATESQSNPASSQVDTGA